MVSEVIKEKIAAAGGFLDRLPEMGFQAISNCNAQLDDIKIFVHEDEPYQKIVEKERELDVMFLKRFEEDTAKLEQMGAYYKFVNQQRIEFMLSRWKCQQRLSFYDWLAQKYDI